MADPTPSVGVGKSVAAGTAGAASVLLAYIAEQIIGHPLPGDVVAAATALISTLSVYLVPHNAVGGGSSS